MRKVQLVLLVLVAAVASVAGAARAADASFWSNGSQAMQYGTNCSIIGAPYEELQITSQVSYGGLPALPKVGERFSVAITYGHPGYACAPGYLADVTTELVLPAGVSPAIDDQHGIHCYATHRSDGSWYDATNEAWAYPDGGPSGKVCKTTVTPGGHGGIDLGLRPLITGTIFQIVVPVVATRELKGAAANPADEFKSYTQSSVVGSKYEHPGSPYYENPAIATVWANVAANPPSAFYPEQPASDITAITAKTTGVVVGHYAPGTAYLDLGTTTDYGRSQAVALDGANDANLVWATWDGLAPSTTYHWRVRFVGANGLTAVGPDQTVRTAEGPATTPGGGTGSGGTTGSGTTGSGTTGSGTTTAGSGAAGGSGSTAHGTAANGTGTGTGAAAAAAPVAIVLKASAATLARIRRGLAVPVRVPGAGRVAVVLRRGGAVVARGTATAVRASAVTVRLRPARRARAGGYRIEVTFTPGAGAPARAAVSVRIR